MLKYAEIIDQETKRCNVGIGTDVEYYQSIGMTEMDVEQAWDGGWYLKGYVPAKPIPTDEEQRKNREYAYAQEVDCITAHIQRLRDEEQTPEIEAEIEQLIAERAAKVEEIKQRYPYSEE